MNLDRKQKLRKLILRLFEVGGLKFGRFIMRNNEETPVYIDMRVIWSYPDIVVDVTDLLWEEIDRQGFSFGSLCGLPYQGIPLASVISTKHQIPMLLKRKQVKKYGTMNMFEGTVTPGTSVLIVDDVLMTGGTFADDIPVFKEAELDVCGAVVFFDRQQGGKERIKHIHNVDIISILNLDLTFEVLLEEGKVSREQADKTMAYIRSNRFDTPEYGVHSKKSTITNGHSH